MSIVMLLCSRLQGGGVLLLLEEEVRQLYCAVHRSLQRRLPV